MSRAPAAAKMPASDEELREIEELKAMIHGTPSRGSTVPLGAVTRFMVGEENRKKADDARKEKEERDALKAEVDAMRKANADSVRAKRQEIIDNERKVRENERQRKQAEGQRLREREASWKAKAAAKKQKDWEIAQKRVQEENELFKRMAANEAAQDKLERDVGTKDKNEREAAARAEKQAVYEANRQQVLKVKKWTDPSVIEEALAWAAQKREAAAAARKREQEALAARKKENKEKFLNNASKIKEGVANIKSNAKAVQSQVLTQKKAHAAKERDNDYLVQQEKIRTLASKKRQHQEVYGKKFAAGELAASWLGASTLRRGGPKRDASPEPAS